MGLDFPCTAHKLVGEIVSSAERTGQTLIDAAAETLDMRGTPLSLEGLDAQSIVQASLYGGGPAPSVTIHQLEVLEQKWCGWRKQKSALSRKWANADGTLQLAVQAIDSNCSVQQGAETLEFV